MSKRCEACEHDEDGVQRQCRYCYIKRTAEWLLTYRKSSELVRDDIETMRDLLLRGSWP